MKLGQTTTVRVSRHSFRRKFPRSFTLKTQFVIFHLQLPPPPSLRCQSSLRGVTQKRTQFHSEEPQQQPLFHCCCCCRPSASSHTSSPSNSLRNIFASPNPLCAIYIKRARQPDYLPASSSSWPQSVQHWITSMKTIQPFSHPIIFPRHHRE